MGEHICDGQWRYYCEACSGLPEAGEKPMSDQDNLRDRMAETVESASFQWDTDFNAWTLGRPNSADPGPKSPRIAQAIIDEFELTVHGDGCGYHEIDGSYDTRFEEKR